MAGKSQISNSATHLGAEPSPTPPPKSQSIQPPPSHSSRISPPHLLPYTFSPAPLQIHPPPVRPLINQDRQSLPDLLKPLPEVFIYPHGPSREEEGSDHYRECNAEIDADCGRAVDKLLDVHAEECLGGLVRGYWREGERGNWEGDIRRRRSWGGRGRPFW